MAHEKGARGDITIDHSKLRTVDYVELDDMTEDQQAKVRLMRDNGIVNPVLTMQACLAFDIPPYMECAYLEHESFKGKNVWHNDDTWMIGSKLRSIGLEEPTDDTYGVYKLHRKRFGFQGIGPNALTSEGFQDLGDSYGGSQYPRSNMSGACHWFRERLDLGDSMDDIAHRYNPGSPTYVTTNRELRRKWRALLNP